MKPFAFPLLLLAALLIGGIVSSSWVRWVQEPITDGLELAAEAGALENWEQAKTLCDAARQRWEAYRHALAAVMDHRPMEEIDSLFGEMDFYRQAKNSALFSGICQRLSRMTQALGEALSFSWWNLL